VLEPLIPVALVLAVIVAVLRAASRKPPSSA